MRLDADAFRDYVIAVSGRLDTQIGGPAIQNFKQQPGPQSTPKLITLHTIGPVQVQIGVASIAMCGGVSRTR